MAVRIAAALLGILCAAADPAIATSKAAALRGNPGQFFTEDDYPPEALRAQQQGRVIVKLWIDVSGKVASCTLQQSSGSRSLDSKTCEIALDRVTFTPATDMRGRPIAATYTLPVRWVLPSGPVEVGSEPLETRIEQTISIDSAGMVVACNSTMTPRNEAAADPCAEFPVGKELPNPWLLKGKPVGGVIKRELHEQITLDQP